MATPAETKPEEQFMIIGDDAPFVRILMGDGQPHQRIEVESGAMAAKTADVEMEVSFEGGLKETLGRLATGENVAVNVYSVPAGKTGTLWVNSPNPGPIKRLDVIPGKPWWVQHDGFLCGANVKVEAKLVKDPMAMLFGGEGVFMQHITTEGTENGIAYIDGGGSHLELNLQADEVIRVDTGLIMAYEDTVKYGVKPVVDASMLTDLKKLGRGIIEGMLGGEGIVYATLTGPGRCYIESLPLARRRGRMTGETKEGSASAPLEQLVSILRTFGHQK